MQEYPRIFPELYDLTDFFKLNHPKNEHPQSVFYAEYWQDFERKSIEGVWGKDKEKNKGGWRYCPPPLFFFINGMQVPIQKGNTSVPGNPLCHDIEFIQAYNWFACRGFSNFENDNKNSCFRPLRKLHTKEELTEEEKFILGNVDESVYMYKGKLKNYVDATEYLYNVHPEAMGLPEYHNTALDDLILGSRGGSKTTFNSVVSYHEFMFFGATRFDEKYFKAPINSGGQRIFLSSSSEKNVNDMIRVFEINFNYHRNILGAYRDNNSFYPGMFHMNSIGKLESNNVKSKYKHVIEFQVKDNTGKKTNTLLQSGAELNFAVETTTNSAPAVGGRYTVKVKDEVGKNKNYKLSYELEKPTQVVDYKFGSCRSTGTSGELDKMMDIQYYMYNPDSNDILSFEDVYEKKGRICFFLSAILVDRKFKDELGNTLYDKALRSQLEIREKLKDDPEALAFRKLNYPIYPSEMFGSNKQSGLPKELAMKHLIYLDKSKDYRKVDTGYFKHDEKNDTVKWVSTPEKKDELLIEHEPQRKGKSLHGGIAIYEHPIKNLPARKTFNNLHKGFADVVQRDGEDFVSLFVGYIYKGIPESLLDTTGQQGTIVASVIMRRTEVEAGLEQMFLLCLYYNCYFFYEGNVGPTTTFARLKGWSYLLQPTPTTALAKGKNSTGDTGMIMTEEKKTVAIPWLNEFYKEVIGYDEDNNPITRLETIRCRMQIHQIALFKRGPKANFDCISTMLLLMFWLKAEAGDWEEEEKVVSSNYEKQLEYFTKEHNHEEFDIDIWI